MSFCPKCGAPIEDGLAFCPQCGVNLNSPQAAQPVVSVYDHTAEFDPADISENKVLCMCVYLLGTIGIIIALLAGKDSAYTQFHVRQSLKLTVTTLLLTICALVLCWTIIVPIAAGICMFIVLILKIIAFFQIAQGKAVELAIIRGLGFLK